MKCYRSKPSSRRMGQYYEPLHFERKIKSWHRTRMRIRKAINLAYSDTKELNGYSQPELYNRLEHRYSGKPERCSIRERRIENMDDDFKVF